MRAGLVAVVSSLILGWVLGCAHGPIFQEMKDVPGDRALIYFYHPQESMASGGKYEVKWMEQRIGLLKTGRYFPYLALPGHYIFYVETLFSFSKKDMDVEPGTVYYARCRTKGWLRASLTMELVPPLLGRAEIMDCRLLR